MGLLAAVGDNLAHDAVVVGWLDCEVFPLVGRLALVHEVLVLFRLEVVAYFQNDHPIEDNGGGNNEPPDVLDAVGEVLSRVDLVVVGSRQPQVLGACIATIFGTKEYSISLRKSVHLQLAQLGHTLPVRRAVNPRTDLIEEFRNSVALNFEAITSI